MGGYGRGGAGGTRSAPSARGASADPPAAEAKFKSHNKIVCHREAINGGGFIADSPKGYWQLI